MYHADTVANYIVCYCAGKGLPLNNLRLQKILYFVQAQFLVEKGDPCFFEEIEARSFGPVVPEVYDKYEKYGNSELPFLGQNFSQTISEPDRTLIKETVDALKIFSNTKLVEIVYDQTPWLHAYVPHRRNIITKLSLLDFFGEEDG